MTIILAMLCLKKVSSKIQYMRSKLLFTSFKNIFIEYLSFSVTSNIIIDSKKIHCRSLLLLNNLLMVMFLNRQGAKNRHGTATENHEQKRTPSHPEDSNNLQLGFTNRAVSLTTEDERQYTGLNSDSGYTPPVNQWHGYTEIMDYDDSIQDFSTSSTQAVSMATEDDSGYINMRLHDYNYIEARESGLHN